MSNADLTDTDTGVEHHNLNEKQIKFSDEGVDPKIVLAIIITNIPSPKTLTEPKSLLENVITTVVISNGFRN